MPRLAYDVIVPEFKPEILREPRTVAVMAATVSRAVKAQAARGIGAHGALPSPKAGGRAYNQTGTLVRSISAVPSKRNPKRWLVRATGARAGGKAKAKRARARTKALRSARVATFLASNPLAAFTMGKRERRKALGLGRLRRRAADTNSSLAAILSVKPKDQRAKRGRRGVYRVLEATDRYRKMAAAAAAKYGRYRLRQSGTRKA